MFGHLCDSMMNGLVGARANHAEVGSGIDIDLDNINFADVDVSGCRVRTGPCGRVGGRVDRVIN